MKLTMHPNTIKLINLHDKAIELGWNKKYPRTNFCEEVARRSGEMGNENPSDNAIKIAEKMIEQLERQKKWSMS